MTGVQTCAFRSITHGFVGHWSTSGYHFEASRALVDENHFIGLAIDEDRQPELTSERINIWVKQLSTELNL